MVRNAMDIKLFVCCHQECEVPGHPLLVPMQVGAALSDKRFPDFWADDAGDNISLKNHSYCELTAQYWAWKNVNADYYGFFHYRRYLYPDAKARRPYRIKRTPSSRTLLRLGYDNLPALIERYDLIVPKGENMFLSVRDHYAGARFHHRKDLELIEQIVKARHPEMTMAVETYLSGTVCYFGNIYIMNRTVFHDYCGWLFPILEEFDRRADLTGYSSQELRVDGYLAERLLGIYYTYQKQKAALKMTELPRVHFDSVTGQLSYKNRLIYYLLPPGSKRRSIIKRYWNGN